MKCWGSLPTDTNVAIMPLFFVNFFRCSVDIFWIEGDKRLWNHIAEKG
jgi:hypothetical protein